MKKKFIIILFSIIAGLIGLTVLSACDIGSRYNNEALVDGVVLKCNDTHKKSLAAYCRWDGDKANMEFTVPDEYCGYKVVCLGAKSNPGFSGKPSPFSVFLPNKIDGLDIFGLYSFVPEDCNSDNTTELNFTVNLGKYVCEISSIRKTALYAFGEIKDGGKKNITAYYNINVYFNVDDENNTFYSQNGDIYYKSNGKMIGYAS